MQVLTHLFGSTDGYKSLAHAVGVTDIEDAALAALGFGSPKSSDEFEGLATSPCLAGRLLPSGRYAITRLFQGAVDVAGRQTVERRTIILSNEQWFECCRCDLQSTVLQVENWRRDAFVAGEKIQLEVVPSEELLPQPSEIDRRAYDSLLSAQDVGRCAVLPSEPPYEMAIFHLANLLPTDRIIAFGWGIGLWSVPPGVWLATLRTHPGGRTSFSAPTAGGWRHAEQVAALGSDAAPLQRMQVQRPKEQRRPRWMIPAVLIAILVVLLGVLAIWFLNPSENLKTTAVNPSQRQTGEKLPQIATETPGVIDMHSTAAAPSDAAVVHQSTQANKATNDAKQTESFGSVSGSTQTGQPTSQGKEASEKPPSSSASAAGTQATPQATPTTNPPATSTSNPPPNIPPVSSTSTMWDDQVQTLAEAIDLRVKIILLSTNASPDAAQYLELCTALQKQSKEASKLALDLSKEMKNDGTTALQILAYKQNFCMAEDLAQATLTTTFPVHFYKQIALLMSRFEQCLSNKRLHELATQFPRLQTAEITDLFKDVNMEALKEWPNGPAFNTWCALKKEVRDKNPLSSCIPMIAEVLQKSISGTGSEKIIAQLKREQLQIPPIPLLGKNP